ncbi:MAG: DUF1800 domain-containing protein [Chloroflexi bacterium]|nr:MAG: DUF1800 domain-containing protein [Chloroflexota bacterium]
MMLSRRNFLKVFGVSGLSFSGLATTLAKAPPGTFAPAQIGERDPIQHIINRLTFGPQPGLYDYISQIGVDEFIERQLDYESIQDNETDHRLQAFPLINEHGGDLIADMDNNRRRVLIDLIGSWLTRAIYSNRQLYERMVHFWSDHFNVYINKGPVLFLKLDDDRDHIRPNAMLSFIDVLRASAQSPAMLFYLDNALSNDFAPNENYGRELLELHTLGVNGGYTEDDVKAVSRVFTGWSITNFREPNSPPGRFIFRRVAHDSREAIVLGEVIPANSGIDAGYQVLEILAKHPSTAQFISSKLIRRFVADTPPQSLVDLCTQVYLDTGGDIKSLLREIFRSDEFWQAPPKFKRPFEYVVGLLRVLNYDVQRPRRFYETVAYLLISMGHLPFNWPAPNGYPDVGRYWMDNLLPRWNAALAAMFYDEDDTSPDYTGLVAMLQNAGVINDAEAALQFMARYMLGRELTGDELTITFEFMRGSTDDLWEQLILGTVLILASPAFQYK